MNDDTQFDTGAIGQKFYLRDIQLYPFSLARRSAFYRIRHGDVSKLESDALLLYVLTQDEGVVDRVRGEDREVKFRLDAFKWAEQFKDGELMAAADKVTLDLEKALSVEPDNALPAKNG